jgi:hypothetical protein
MKKITKASAKTLRSDLEKALAAVAKKHDLEFEIGAIRFNEAEASMTLKTKVKGAVTKEQAIYEFEASMRNLPAFGATILAEGEEYKILGWNSRAKKFPITALEIKSNKKYKLTVDMVANAQVI